MVRSLRPLFAVWIVAACPPPPLGELPAVCDPQVGPCAETDTNASTGTTTDDMPSSGVQTVTVSSGSSSTGGEQPGSTGSSSTTAEIGPPVILEVALDPMVLTKAGTIAVEVATMNASAVEVALDDGSTLALTPKDRDHFTGEFQVLSGLVNGDHLATLTPSGEGPGAAVTAPYTVMLPLPGSEARWDASPDLGTGEVRALGVTSTHVLEFGTRHEQGETRCYLRRRDFVGKYGDADILDLMPGKICSATDLVVGPADEIYLLARVTLNGVPRWWLGEVTTWGPPLKIDDGSSGEVAHALTLGPAGELVACGAGPSPSKDLDARYWLTFDGGFGETKSFDYAPLPFPVHSFDETITDCAFAGPTLVTVGEVFGFHEAEPQMIKRKRLGLLEIDRATETHTWTVAETGPGNMTQSSGTALAIDDQGRYLVGLYTCADKCDTVGEFRVYAPGGTPAEPPITLAAGVQPPFALAWSPARHLVLASTRGAGWNTEFFVQAYVLGEPLPAWTFAKTEVPGPNVAQALALLPGVVLAGGFDADNFPALAFIYD